MQNNNYLQTCNLKLSLKHAAQELKFECPHACARAHTCEHTYTHTLILYSINHFT